MNPALLVALPAALAGAAAPPSLQGWIDAPALAGDPAAILREFQGIKAADGVGVQLLLEEMHLSFDAQGRRTRTNHWVFRVDEAAHLEGWRTVDAEWRPWNEERPVIRARVLTPDGGVYLLDPATLGEFPVDGQTPKLYDDRKRIAGPLPHLALGAVAEVEVVYRETSPNFPAGTRASINLGFTLPIRHFRGSIEAPESLGLRWKLRDLPGVKVRPATRDGRIRIALELGPLEAAPKAEPHEDPAGSPHPALLATTFPSWGAVASAYADVVDRRMKDADLKDWTAPGTSTELRAVINGILTRMGREIRYTGVEFGEGSLVPRTPGEILTRGYGDCKDKATFLVAILRARGIPARVALLAVGPGQDVDPDMPGIAMFDHAIVYVPGSEPLWIDPTAEEARAGILPSGDQGRLALVASPETTALLRTPQTEGASNLTLETREIFLADLGNARVVETSLPAGLAEMDLREQFPPRRETKTVREGLVRYLKDAYGAGDLGAMDLGDASDLGRPFTLRAEALDASVGRSGDVDAAVTVNLWGMGRKLRQTLDADQGNDGPTPPARTRALLFPEPHAVEWRYHIVPPPGFLLRATPKDGTEAFGPATLASTFQARADGVLDATFRLDTGKRLWTAAEVEAARTAFKTFGKSAPLVIAFDREGEALLAAGRIKEALEAFRRVALAEPSQAIPLSRVARTLLEAGQGEAARTLARKACALDPASSLAQRNLGWILQHDLVNRIYHPGWDGAGAQAAFRKAKALDPKDALVRKNLAILLERNADGEEYGPGAPLDQAIQEFRDFHKDFASDDLNNNLAQALVRTGKFREALEFMTSTPPSSGRSAWIATLLLCTRETRAALDEFATIVPNPSEQRTALLNAGDLLVPLRRYPEAAAALSAGAPGAQDPAAVRTRAGLLGRTRRYEDLPMDPTRPETGVKRAFASAFTGVPPKDLTTLFTPALAANMGDIRPGKRKGGSQTGGLSQAVLLDIALSLSEFTVDPGGSDTRGYRVRMFNPLTPNAGSAGWFVVPVKGRYVVAAMDSETSTFGIEALRRLEGKDLEGARACLDWARELIGPRGGDDPLKDDPFCRLWTKGHPGTPEEIRWASALLEAPDKDCRAAVRLLLEGRAKASDDAARLLFDRALLNAYESREDWKALEPLARRLQASHPASTVPPLVLSSALAGTGRWEELLTFTDAFLKEHPENVEFQRIRAGTLGNLVRHEERERQYQSIIDAGKGTAMDYNNLAWSALIGGRATEATVELARKSLLLRPDDASTLHTLSALLAERGDIAGSLETLRKEMEQRDEAQPTGEEWYVFGRIAELVGEKGAAIASYRRVSPPKGTSSEADSCHALARKRLALLEPAP